MAQNNIKKILRTTREVNAIVGKAGVSIAKTSFGTVKQIAGLYKETGFKAFKVGKDVLKKTVELTINNQKEIIKTSGEALKAFSEHLKDHEVEDKAKMNGTAKQGKKAKNKEVTIDDLLD